MNVNCSNKIILVSLFDLYNTIHRSYMYNTKEHVPTLIVTDLNNAVWNNAIKSYIALYILYITSIAITYYTSSADVS